MFNFRAVFSLKPIKASLNQVQEQFLLNVFSVVSDKEGLIDDKKQ